MLIVAPTEARLWGIVGTIVGIVARDSVERPRGELFGSAFGGGVVGEFFADRCKWRRR